MFFARFKDLAGSLALLSLTVAVAGCRREVDPSAVLATAAGAADAKGVADAGSASAKASEGTAPPGDLPILPRLQGTAPVSLDGCFMDL